MKLHGRSSLTLSGSSSVSIATTDRSTVAVICAVVVVIDDGSFVALTQGVFLGFAGCETGIGCGICCCFCCGGGANGKMVRATGVVVDIDLLIEVDV